MLSIAGAYGLGRKTAGREAQETKTPEKKGKNQGTNGYGTNVVGIRQLPDDGRVDHTDQGFRRIRQHDRHGNCQHGTVVYGHEGSGALHAARVALELHPSQAVSHESSAFQISRLVHGARLEPAGASTCSSGLRNGW